MIRRCDRCGWSGKPTETHKCITTIPGWVVMVLAICGAALGAVIGQIYP